MTDYTGELSQAGTVLGTAPVTVAGASPSGVPMPVGNLPGWRQIFTDDFTTDVASWGTCTPYGTGVPPDRTCGQLPAAYVNKWWAYPTSYQDTREKISGDGGFYTPSNQSMTGSVLRLRLRRVSGTSQSCAPIPKLSGGEAQTYGRYAIRFKSDSSSTFKVAWLLWRTSASWGEIDFPEANLNGTISAFNHHSNGSQTGINTSTQFAGQWHTAVIEWKPGNVSFFLNGTKIGEDTGSNVPSSPMTWVIQSETQLSGALAANAPDALIDIDWVAVYAYDTSVV